MKNLVFCIPSYKRAEPIKTLELFPNAKIFVCESEIEDYRKSNPNGDFEVVADSVQGNVGRVRNFILDMYQDSCVVMLDDDISGIFRMVVNGYIKSWKEVEKDKLEGLFCRFADLCEEWGFSYFGLQCNSDSMVSRNITPFSSVSFIGGPVQGFLPSNKCRYDESLPLKEDYDMTLQQCNKERGCLRFNMYCYHAKQSEQKGGCASYRTIQREREQLERLQKKWGSKIVKIDKSNKGRSNKKKIIDYNPIIHIPIKGV